MIKRIRFGYILMDLLIVFSPFWSADLFGPENSIYFFGFTAVWVMVNIRNNLINKQRYMLDK